MGETDIEGFGCADEQGGYWMVAYDPMPGGSGFLPQLVAYWETIVERAREALDACPSDCQTACYSCLKHFRNQIHHDILDRHQAIDLLDRVAGPLTLPHPNPAGRRRAAHAVDPKKADSDAEYSFATICQKRAFPVPAPSSSSA